MKGERVWKCTTGARSKTMGGVQELNGYQMGIEWNRSFHSLFSLFWSVFFLVLVEDI